MTAVTAGSRHDGNGEISCRRGRRFQRRLFVFRLSVLCRHHDDNFMPVCLAFEGDVRPIGKLKPQSVFARRQFQKRRRLRLTVVEVLFICGNYLTSGNERRIYQNVEVPCSFVDLAGRLDYEAGRFHFHLEGRGDGGAVGRLGKAH